MSQHYDVEFLESERCGAEILSARFSRPEGFDFAAGQWMIVKLATDEGPVAETFTISSAPLDDYLQLTTRLSSSAFKRALERLSAGDSAELNGPGGRLVLPPALDRIAFLVGGVGITPVRSMLRDAQAAGRTFDDALLLYGNRDESCVPFDTELRGMEDIGVRMVLCFEYPPADWTGERGLITAEMVGRYLDPEDQRPFVVAGPPVMVQAMERVLDNLAVPPARRMVERFGSPAA